jgi:hypothetical protein
LKNDFALQWHRIGGMPALLNKTDAEKVVAQL